jgi:lipoprotein-anchoring transpeptidase ErfK/SrfK
VVVARHHGLVAYLGNVALVSYRVGLGKQNRTPTGDFTIQVKQENPSWWKDGAVVPYGDPENVLGTRWMGFENRPGTSGYGIHGTDVPSSIGKDMSMGCVRMRNEEVQELFDFVPRGTLVTIQ